MSVPPTAASARSCGPRAALALAFLLLAPATPARAEVHPQAQPVYDHLLAATGGRAARERERSVRFKGRLESMGLKGRWEMWIAAPDRWTRRYTLGSMRFREGYDGTTAWRTDLTGRTVTVLSEAALRDAREEGWFLNERWALADQGGGSIRTRSRSWRGDVAYQVLEITPPQGRPRRLFVNEKTGLLERVLSEHDQYTVEDQPRAYRTLGGRKRPSVYQSPTLLPGEKPADRMTVDSVWVNLPVDPSRFSPPRVAERRVAWQGARDAIRVPFAYTSRTVLVQVSINGAPPADFILDTGATLTAIDADYAYGLGLAAEGESSVQGIAASGEARFARVKSIALQGENGAAVTLRDFQIGMVELSEGSDVILWRKPVGLLGYDFLSRFVVEIDYDSSRVTLYDPARFAYAGRGAAIPFELDNGTPVVEMTLDQGCSGKFLVDVGNAFGFTVHGSAVRPCGLLSRPGRHGVEVMGGGIGGGFISTLCRLDSLRIGPFEWSDPVAALALHTRGGIGSKDLAGNVGNHLLERFRCTFDYAHRTLWLEPGRRYGQRDRVSRFGAMMARLGDRVLAGNILSGSACYEAGLRWFDEILAIDGKPIAKWTREEIDRKLEEGPVGSVHKVRYRRFEDQPPETVEVTLKDVL